MNKQCDEAVKEAIEISNSSPTHAAYLFEEAAKCYDLIDREKAAKYYTLAADLYLDLKNDFKAATLYGKAVIRFLMAGKLTRAEYLVEKGNQLGFSSYQFKLALAAITKHRREMTEKFSGRKTLSKSPATIIGKKELPSSGVSRVPTSEAVEKRAMIKAENITAVDNGITEVHMVDVSETPMPLEIITDSSIDSGESMIIREDFVLDGGQTDLVKIDEGALSIIESINSLTKRHLGSKLESTLTALIDNKTISLNNNFEIRPLADIKGGFVTTEVAEESFIEEPRVPLSSTDKLLLNRIAIIPDEDSFELNEIEFVDVIPSQLEVVDTVVDSEIELVDQNRTAEGIVFRWRKSGIKPGEKINFKYVVKQKVLRKVYIKPLGSSKVKVISLYLSIDNFKINSEFIIEESNKVDILIEDVFPKEYTIKKCLSSPTSTPSVGRVGKLTVFKWFYHAIESGSIININYSLNEFIMGVPKSLTIIGDIDDKNSITDSLLSTKAIQKPTLKVDALKETLSTLEDSDDFYLLTGELDIKDLLLEDDALLTKTTGVKEVLEELSENILVQDIINVVRKSKKDIVIKNEVGDFVRLESVLDIEPVVVEGTSPSVSPFLSSSPPILTDKDFLMFDPIISEDNQLEDFEGSLVSNLTRKDQFRPDFLAFSTLRNDNVSDLEQVEITDVIPLQYEVIDVVKPSLLKLKKKEVTSKGTRFLWNISKLRVGESLKINYVIRNKLARTIYIWNEDRISLIKTYHNTINMRSNISFKNTSKKTIHQVLIEDRIPPELMVKKYSCDLGIEPTLIPIKSTTIYRWLIKNLVEDQIIQIRYSFEKKPVSSVYITEIFLDEEFWRIEKIAQPIYYSDPYTYLFYYEISGRVGKEITLYDYLPSNCDIIGAEPLYNYPKIKKHDRVLKLTWKIIMSSNKMRFLMRIISPKVFRPAEPIIKFNKSLKLVDKQLERDERVIDLRKKMTD